MTDNEEVKKTDRRPGGTRECPAPDSGVPGDESKAFDEREEQRRLAEQRLDQLRYLQADFDNYRKQFEKEKERIIRYAEFGIIQEILPVVDDLERAAGSIADPAVREGVNMVYRNLWAVLSHHGVRKIESTGKKFDPEFHEVLCQERSDSDEGTVIEEIVPGYMMNSMVLRPSKVKIAAKFDES